MPPYRLARLAGAQPQQIVLDRVTKSIDDATTQVEHSAARQMIEPVVAHHGERGPMSVTREATQRIVERGDDLESGLEIVIRIELLRRDYRGAGNVARRLGHFVHDPQDWPNMRQRVHGPANHVRVAGQRGARIVQ